MASFYNNNGKGNGGKGGAAPQRRRGEEGAIELTADGVGDPRVALATALVRDCPRDRILELVAGVVAAHDATGDPQFLIDLVLIMYVHKIILANHAHVHRDPMFFCSHITLRIL